MFVEASSFQPSRIGFGSIFGAPLPAGWISKWTCGACLPVAPPTRPRIVPPITFYPGLSGRRRAWLLLLLRHWVDLLNRSEWRVCVVVPVDVLQHHVVALRARAPEPLDHPVVLRDHRGPLGREHVDRAPRRRARHHDGRVLA